MCFINKSIKKKKVLPYFNEIRDIIYKWDVRLLTEKTHYEKIFNELLTNNRLLKFIKDKSVDDIMNLQELIDPSQSQLITINDIHDLEDLIKLKNGLKEISDKDDIIKELSNLINKLYRENNEKEKILKQIRSLSDKILEIIEIFNKN